jgi:iron complex outermembrane recepter protein
VQFGGRESEDRQVYNEVDSGPSIPDQFGVPTTPFVNPTEHTDGSAFTYLVTPQFRISHDLMAYARFSSGYRLGGPNFNATVGDIPEKYAPDKTNNYDLGVKGQFFENRLSLDASLYYINWKNIQISLYNPVTYFDYNANAGDARSDGLEFSLQARPTAGLSVTTSVSLNDAELTQPFPASISSAIANAGAALPYTSHYTGSVIVNQDIPIVNDWLAFVGGTFSYIGERRGEFVAYYLPAGTPRVRYPGFADTDFRVGLKRDTWTINLFANNLFNKRGAIGGGSQNTISGYPYYVTYIQPLTVGLSVSKDF